MVAPKKPILVIALFSLLISCGNIEEQQKSTQKNRAHPSSKDKKSELPTTKPELLKPTETPIKKEEEKKKFSKLDTLKPVVVIP